MTPDFEQKARELAPCSETFCNSVNGLDVYHAKLCAVHLRPAIAQALREMYEAGRAGNGVLDRLWGKVNVLGGCNSRNDYNDGINVTVDQVLACIEELGGMDPLKRAAINPTQGA